MSFKRALLNVAIGLWSVALVLTPFLLGYVAIDPFAVSYLNILSLVTLGLGLISLLVGNFPIKKITSRSLLLVLGGLLLAMGWGLAHTDPLTNGYGLWVSRLVQPLLMGYLGYLFMVNQQISFGYLAKLLYVSLILLALSGLSQLAGLEPYLETGRVTGPYNTANTFARYLETLLLILLPWLIFTRRWWWFLGWLAGVAVLIFTLSYNGVATFWVGLLAVIGLCPASVLTTKLKKIILTGLIAVAILIGLNARSLPKFQTSITDSRLSRLEYWAIAWGAIKEHPLTGIGIKTWELTYPDLVVKYGTVPPRNWSSSQPHNVLLDAWLKAGWPGAVAVMAFLLWPLVVGWKLIKRSQIGSSYWLAISVPATALALLLFGAIDDPIWHDDIMPLIMVGVFGLASLTNLAREENVG